MNRTILLLLSICLLLMFATACSAQNPADADSALSEPQMEADLMPIYFDSEEQLISAINEVKSKAGTEDSIVIVKSNTAGEQSYSSKRDVFGLASISEFYKPVNILKGISLKEIHVISEYIAYVYVNEDQMDCATFTWLREMPPEVAMNDLYGRGAMSEREIEHNGIKYVFLEWADSKTNKSAGYSVHWVVEGKAYQASVPSSYTDDEILAFCQFEAVAVK